MASQAQMIAAGGRRSDAAENDATILNAAIHLMERTDALPSIREVAREASVGTVTVYRRFATKEALHSRIRAEVRCRAIAPIIARAQHAADPLEGLREVTERLVEATHGMEDTATSLVDLTEVFLDHYGAQIRQLMLAAQDAGKLRPDIAADDVEGITALIIAGLAVPRHREGAANRYIALIFDGLSRTDGQRLPE